MTRAFVDVINCIHESPRYLCPELYDNEVYSFLVMRLLSATCIIG